MSGTALIDFKNPDYTAIERKRYTMIKRLRVMPARELDLVKIYYRDHIDQFISDFAMTYDPRVTADGRAPFMPMILFPKQVEMVHFVINQWKTGKPGIVVKSRDVGASWLVMAISCSLCIFYKNMAIGVGSALKDKLDRSGDPDCIFYKGRQFMRYLPREFRGSWDIDEHAPDSRILFPDTGSSITGEVGDKIGRGGRKAIYFVDEAAHIERPKLVDRALQATTRCRIDLSSVNGMANSFGERANNGKIARFDFDWSEDPRKDQAWYDQQCEDNDPITIAQEVDRNFLASQEGIVIPNEFVQAAIDADQKIKDFPKGGMRHGALDIADEGIDKNAFGARYGNVLEYAESWSGKRSDLFATTERAFMLADEWKLTSFAYDNDGMGANVKGDARVINERRRSLGYGALAVESFRGSGAVLWPERQMVKGRKNEDFFANFKAQSWWWLRLMFQETYRASIGKPYDPSKLIAIRAGFKEFPRLKLELCQPVYSINTSGKIVIDKSPDGVASPNLGDVVMMCFAPRRAPMKISDQALDD